MALSVITIRSEQLQAFENDLLDRLALKAARFLHENDDRQVTPRSVRACLDQAMADGFEATEDLLRYAVLRARAPASVFEPVMGRREADPVTRLLHMRDHHPDLWDPMVGDLDQ